MLTCRVTETSILQVTAKQPSITSYIPFYAYKVTCLPTSSANINARKDNKMNLKNIWKTMNILHLMFGL